MIKIEIKQSQAIADTRSGVSKSTGQAGDAANLLI